MDFNIKILLCQAFLINICSPTLPIVFNIKVTTFPSLTLPGGVSIGAAKKELLSVFLRTSQIPTTQDVKHSTPLKKSERGEEALGLFSGF